MREREKRTESLIRKQAATEEVEIKIKNISNEDDLIQEEAISSQKHLRKQHPEGNMTPSSDLPTSSQKPQTTSNNGCTTDAVGNDVPQSASGPPMNHKEKPSDQSGLISSRPQTSMDNSIGIRQRLRPSVYNPKPITAESPVTLERLFKELYKNHPPDKLKNVSTVAKQYAGKERELVGLFKGNYGALSVRRLEENLDVLERLHQARMSCKESRKQRDCFIHLAVSASIFLARAFFVNFVVLDAWECHSIEEKEHEVTEVAGDFHSQARRRLREPIAPVVLLLFGVEGSRKSVVRDPFGRRTYQFGKNGSVFP
ncbi:hypothetical protein PsorP6_001714 [Peronosclerospora sorghi]|uniref:Uncharacterized protein n=1 Tax=Peronosclerospora sorghi TaxID=230839 RepID=A0ACC0WS54_9STRA|nr:hypothetical protein PsorP6_001714 [Peronosclerospora sorghi]